jgi:hypothetical protein
VKLVRKSRPQLRQLCSSVMALVACAAPASLAQERVFLPPSQDVAPAIITADSGIKTSAAGRRWSDWYRLGVGKAPNGYTLQKAEFWLTGDRTCGVLAECRELTKSDQEVLWEFRLQGQNGPAARKTIVSEGHIRVKYRPR